MRDGTSLNAKLAALMPLVSGVKSISIPPETPLEEGAEYSFVITPASGDMAGYKAGIENTLSDEKGAPLSGSASAVDRVFQVNAFAFNGFEEDEGEMFPNETATVEIYIGHSGN